MSETDCQKVLRELELYLDRELEDSKCAEIKRHLGECSPCMSRTEFRVSLRALIAEKCGCEDVPASLIVRISEELHRAPDAPA